MSEKITITRALAELKLLDARINKKIGVFDPVDVYQRRTGITKNTALKKEEFEKRAKEEYQSIASLIERRNSIKRAVLLSNSKTTVKIGGEKYAVVEAIDYKNAIQYEKMLLDRFRFSVQSANDTIDDYKPTLDNAVESMLKQNLGVEKKVSVGDYEAIAKPYIEANELIKIDPVSSEKQIATLDKNIDEFLTEIDFALSESNSKTEIEI